METDPKSCSKQILLVLLIWIMAYGLVSLLVGKGMGPFDFADGQLDIRTSILLAHLAQ
ncbi:hypothetical protein IAI18_00470 [Acetobacteraceae bacterium H6797]|nr:hypothetical protein [Acetobacteraceae bacterium H6797]